ncbi:hypothetical protein D0T49_11695 [Paludibacter sp. 221]|uniref:hypothetical protein n=1 Tax=Paludibacter sp. 221 TaxID=2302939 RepID=UPI0013D3C52C|nr:hypothetical protein [Paludibacter sp. 221]NDV47710.1 hypothetical protein [Paludibacter sp. 221]
METRESIEQVLDNLGDNVVYKSKPSIVLSIVLIILGIGLIFLSWQISNAPNSIISPLLIVGGIILLAWGVVSVFFRKTQYKATGNKQKISFSELFFDIKERDRLVRLVSEGNVQDLSKLKTSVSDALKLRVAATPDGNICYTQVVTYVPFEFVNATDARRNTPEEAKKIKELVKTKK